MIVLKANHMKSAIIFAVIHYPTALQVNRILQEEELKQSISCRWAGTHMDAHPTFGYLDSTHDSYTME